VRPFLGGDSWVITGESPPAPPPTQPSHQVPTNKPYAPSHMHCIDNGK